MDAGETLAQASPKGLSLDVTNEIDVIQGKASKTTG